ncbi:hypothetical protein Tco_1144544 [Tanacetum coccineum]
MLVTKTPCDCKPPHPIPIQTAWTTDNPGRRFRGCPIRDKSKKCGVYGFLDLELPSDYYKANIGNVADIVLQQGFCMVVKLFIIQPPYISLKKGITLDIIFTLTYRFYYFSVDRIWPKAKANYQNSCNVGSSKSLVPPFGSPERPRPDVTPRIAESFKSRPCHPELIRMYGYQSTDEYYADYDYWNTWVQDESTDEEDEDRGHDHQMIDLHFIKIHFPVDKFVSIWFVVPYDVIASCYVIATLLSLLLSFGVLFHTPKIIMAKDCLKLYLKEKKKVGALLRENVGRSI